MAGPQSTVRACGVVAELDDRAFLQKTRQGLELLITSYHSLQHIDNNRANVVLVTLSLPSFSCVY
jgi:hypothetical protein